MIGFIWLIIVGAIVGYLATRVMKVDTDIVTTIGIGVVGAVAGGLTLTIIAKILGAMAGTIGAVLGALILVWLWQSVNKKKVAWIWKLFKKTK